MAKIKLTLSEKDVGGRRELFVRFYHSSYNERAKTGIFVLASRWDTDGERLTVPRYKDATANECVKLNAQIDALKNRIFEAFTQTKGALPKNWLRSVLSGDKGEENIKLVSEALIAYADKHVAPTTHKGYQTTAGRVAHFGDIVLATITNRELERYENYLRKHGLSPNTISVDLKKVRAAVRWACLNGYTEQRPFEQFHLPTERYGTPIFLTLAERDQIAQTDYHNAKLNTQRDIFVFHCHIGCRVSDLLRLTPENVKGDFLEYICQKTKNYKPTTVRVPLTDTARMLIERYKGGKKLLPFINSVEYNVVIKRLVKGAQIERVVTILDKHTAQPVNVPIYEVATSHMARRTFMANLFAKTKSERLVTSLTGHAEGSKSLSRYTIVGDEVKKEIIKTIE